MTSDMIQTIAEDLYADEDDEQLQIMYARLSLAVFWDRNPKRHDFGQIATSIARYGFKDPPKFEPELNGGLGGTVEGNGRLETLQLMKDTGLSMDIVRSQGRKTPRGIRLLKDGDWAVPILVGIDAESQRVAEAYGVDHNMTTVGGAGYTSAQLRQMWNEDFLTRVLRDFEGEDVQPVTWDELDPMELLALASEEEEEYDGLDDAGADLEHADELVEKWNVQRGQVWNIESRSMPGQTHRLMCGDSTDQADVDILMEGRKAVLCHADPPYGFGKEAEGVVNDNLYAGKLDKFQMLWWRAFRPYLKDNASAYVWGTAEDLWRLWYGYLLQENGGGLRDSERMTFRNEVVWGKLTGSGDDFDAIGITSDEMRMFPPATERALFFMLGEQGFNNNQDNYWEGWEPIRSYLAAEVMKMNWGPKDVHEITGVAMYGHWFTRSQWVMMRREHYMKLRAASEGKAFLRPYDVQDQETLKGLPLQAEHHVLATEHSTLRQQFYGTRAFFDNTHDRLVDIWTFPRVLLDERFDHPTPKPVAMVERAVKSSAPAGGLVVVPFAGAGSDFVACEGTRRVCYAMEISKRWVAVVLERMAKSGLAPYVAREAEV